MLTAAAINEGASVCPSEPRPILPHMVENTPLSRLHVLETQVAELSSRLAALEGPGRAAQGAPETTTDPAESKQMRQRRTPQPHPSQSHPPNAPPARQGTRLTEDLFGGRVLALVGGVAVLLGLLFFLTLAIKNGLIGESARVLLAAAGSLGLVAGGIWLHERQGQTDASRAAIGVGIAGLFATITTATQVYGFIDPGPGLIVAGLVGAGAVALAIHLDSRLLAGLGIVGSLAAPILVDAPASGSTLIFVVIALLASAAVVLWRKWSWLSAAAFLVSLPQLIVWVDANEQSVTAVLGVLTFFWLVNLVAAIGFDVRIKATTLHVSSVGLALAAAATASATGWIVLHRQGHHGGEDLWIVALAFGHLAIGVLLRRRGVATDIALAVMGIGAILAAIATALILDGPSLVVALCAEAGLLAWISAKSSERIGSLLAFAYFGAAIAHALAVEAPLDALSDGIRSLPDAAIALLVIAATAVWLGRITPPDVLGGVRVVLLTRVSTSIAATAVVYLVSIAIVDVLGATEQRAQTTLSAFWALVGLGLVVWGLVKSVREARLAGLALLSLAIAKLFFYDLANLSSINRAASFVVVGLLLLAGAYAYQRVRESSPNALAPPSDVDDDAPRRP